MAINFEHLLNIFNLNGAKKASSHNTLTLSVLRYGLFEPLKQAFSQRDIGHFAGQKGLYCEARRQVVKNGGGAGRF